MGSVPTGAPLTVSSSTSADEPIREGHLLLQNPRKARTESQQAEQPGELDQQQRGGKRTECLAWSRPRSQHRAR